MSLGVEPERDRLRYHIGMLEQSVRKRVMWNEFAERLQNPSSETDEIAAERASKKADQSFATTLSCL
jgi:hypothetical protein